MGILYHLGYVVFYSSCAILGATAPIGITYGGALLLSEIPFSNEENIRDFTFSQNLENSVHFDAPLVEGRDYNIPERE